ncbi:MAG: hypothetical protein AB7F98_17130 [Novosphingobium sp.]
MSSPHLFGQMVQLGYVVTDFDKASARLGERYGIDRWKVVPLDPGSPASRIAMAYVGDVIFELVEVDLSVDLLPIHRGWLPAEPHLARLNHAAFMLPSLEAWQGAQEHFRGMGVDMPVVMSFGDIFEFFYADTVAELGHWSEFICLGPAGADFLADIPRF